jgi:hypothetical protein
MELERWNSSLPPEERCDLILESGNQCMNRKVPGTPRCANHGGNFYQQRQEKASLRQYRLAKFQTQLEHFSGHSEIKSLREEIGILRMLLEERINKCSDEMDLLLQSGPISDLVVKIDKVVTSCHKLDNSLGGLLDKAKIKNLATQLMQVVASKLNEFAESKKVDVSDVLDAIASSFLEVLKGETQ